MVTPNDTIAAGKAWLRTQLMKGANCPLCNQRAQVYKRKINSGAARGLITMFHLYGKDWGHLPSTATLSRLGGEFARLSLWGLVEEATEKREDGGRAGYWRVTDLGALFIKNQAGVAQYALVYNGKLQGFQGMPVTIKDALGTKFNYEELMRGV